MGAWNGLALQTEFSETLGDTATAFKARVLKFMNDIQDDVCSRYQWPFLKKTGGKTLSTTSEYQNLHTTAPSTAPSIAVEVGGSLTTGSTYTVGVTFYQSSDDYETPLSSYPTALTVSGSSLQLAVSSIPVSTDPLVTARNVYLSKDSGAFYYYSQIANNTATTTTVTADVSSTVEPPDYDGVKELLADPWIESYGHQLQYKSEADLRMLFPNAFGTGQPEWYGIAGQSRIIVYPIPSSALTLRFPYIRIPKRLFASSTSQPELPIWMKPILEAGVLMKGYQYRERDAASFYAQLYEQRLTQAISDSAMSRVGAYRVRDVNGNTDGDVY